MGAVKSRVVIIAFTVIILQQVTLFSAKIIVINEQPAWF